jgi:hypothetical protein
MPAERPSQPLWKQCASAALQAELRGDLNYADEQYRLSITLAEYEKPEDHLGEALTNYADFLAAHNRPGDAEVFYRRAILVYEKLFGPDNLVTGMIYRVLAEIYSAQEREMQAHLLNSQANRIFNQRAS